MALSDHSKPEPQRQLLDDSPIEQVSRSLKTKLMPTAGELKFSAAQSAIFR